MTTVKLVEISMYGIPIHLTMVITAGIPAPTAALIFFTHLACHIY